MLVTVGIVAGDVAPIGAGAAADSVRVNAVAASAVGIDLLLARIGRHREAAGGAVLCHPAEHGHRAERVLIPLRVVALDQGVECLDSVDRGPTVATGAAPGFQSTNRRWSWSRPTDSCSAQWSLPPQRSMVIFAGATAALSAAIASSR